MPPHLFKGVNKRRWDWTVASYPWLEGDEYPAAPFSDLRVTTECEDSVWDVEANRSNLMRLVAALAARRQNPEKFDYVLIEERFIREAGISIRETPGNSADPSANESWHRDLVQLTGRKLITLIYLIHDHGEFDRVPERRVIELLLAGLQAGDLDESRMDRRLLDALGK